MSGHVCPYLKERYITHQFWNISHLDDKNLCTNIFLGWLNVLVKTKIILEHFAKFLLVSLLAYYHLWLKYIKWKLEKCLSNFFRASISNIYVNTYIHNKDYKDFISKKLFYNSSRSVPTVCTSITLLVSLGMLE